MKIHQTKIFITSVLLFVFTGMISCDKNVPSTVQLDCTNPYANSSNTKQAAYQNVLDKYVKLGMPGISALVDDSTGIWAGSSGFADIANGVKFQTCHISKAASITKLLVGTLTMKLQEEGKININDPISKYIDKDILDKIDHADGKTLKQLMNHTTGIFDVITSSKFYLSVLNNPNKTWHQDDLLKYVYGEKGYELNNPYPAYYSNTNTLLLSMCIEGATGEPHEKLLREKILNPLGMNDTYYQGRETLPDYCAQGYFDLHNNGTIVNVSNLVTGSGNGYGGIYSNVFDLHHFIKALLVDKTILSQQSLDEMQQFVREDDDFYTGISMIKKFTYKSAYGIGHTGRDLGYSADLFYFPERNITMVFFVNYGINGNSSLKQTFKDFENELVDKVLQ